MEKQINERVGHPRDTMGWSGASAPGDKGSRRSLLLKAKRGQGVKVQCCHTQGGKKGNRGTTALSGNKGVQGELSLGKSLELMKPKENTVPKRKQDLVWDGAGFG